MTLALHNPVNQAHIEDLKDRLTAQLTQGASDSYGRAWVQAVISTLVKAVQAMDRGAASEADVQKTFSTYHIPSFRFERWLAEMLEEGVYLETAVLQAA